jgi:tetratricopeptide (TPR) repeat protein/predicted Ser/Thr protein kinase
VADPARPAEPDTRVIDRGETVGRFVLIGLLGRGGMGEVYAAYDPELDRKVAVKILRGRSADGEARLLREAQAIAKLQHPNVVVVYDVGSFRDTVFIAMEFVDGHTLGHWMNAERRSWRETLRIFQAAGRGLEAAHELGMVHRDFKPENVMLTKDGQVRVMDFGLARQVGEEGEAAEAPAPAPPAADPDATMPLEGGAKPVSLQSSAGYLSLKLTQTGVQVGTPAYMAPEQFAAKRSDARTDQFSFCVALYEALYGQRPFGGDSVLALMTNVLEGAVRPAPEKARVPSWIRRVLLRGLSTDPDARYPSMKALLAALEADPWVPRRRWLTAAAGAVVVAGLVFAASRVGSGARTMCAGGGARFAGVWEPGSGSSPRREAIRAAFAGTGKSFAAQTFAATARVLDDYVTRWTAMYRSACEATNVRGEQSAEVLDLRMACLGGRVENVRALTDVFAKADGDVVVNAVSAAGALPPLDACADVEALRAVVKPPEDPATRKRVGELGDELARLTAIRDAGGCVEARQRGGKLVEDIRATGYRPLLARALNVVAYLGNFCVEPELSVVRSKEAYYAAVAGRDDEAAVYAGSQVALFMANRLGRPAEARDWLELTHATLAHVPARKDLMGYTLTAEGSVLGAEHRPDAFVATAREAVAKTQEAFGPDHYLVLTGLMNLGDALQAVGRYEEAVAADEAAIAATTRVLGPDHPIVASMSSNACEALNHAGRYAEALPRCRRAMEIWAIDGVDAIFRSYGQTGIGLALVGLGRPGEAVAPLEEALAARVAGHLAGPLQGEPRFALARALWSRPADRPRALALARQARVDDAGDAKAIAEIDAWLAKPR